MASHFLQKHSLFPCSVSRNILSLRNLCSPDARTFQSFILSFFCFYYAWSLILKISSCFSLCLCLMWVSLMRKKWLEAHNFRCIRANQESIKHNVTWSYMKLLWIIWALEVSCSSLFSIWPPSFTTTKWSSHSSNPLSMLQSVSTCVICEENRNGRVVWLMYLKLWKNLCLGTTKVQFFSFLLDISQDMRADQEKIEKRRYIKTRPKRTTQILCASIGWVISMNLCVN